MKKSAVYLAVLSALATSVSMAGEVRSGPQLLVVGPVEAVDAATRSAVILGQHVALENVELLDVHSAVAVFGTRRADGTIQASAVRDQGPYIAGATTIFLSGTVQRAEPSVGHVVLNGIAVDLTPGMAMGTLSPALGSRLTVTGTQALSHGVVTIDGIVGSGATANGIVGSGATANGIVGSGATANGIVGSGYRTNGIVGSGATANGIVGSGATANGIVGSGYRSNGIVGSGATANGIVGSGYRSNGIVGSGASANSIGIRLHSLSVNQTKY